MTALLRRVRRTVGITNAFVIMGYRTAIAYPVNLVASQLRPLTQVLVFFFVAKLVDRSGPDVGGDYFTYVVVGWIVVQVLAAGLESFSMELHLAVQQGRFEMLLVEPVRWRLLPFGLVQWPLLQRMFSALVIFMVSILLGAEYRWQGFVPSLPVLAMGVAGAFAVGLLAGSVVVLAKRGNPVLVVYTFAASILTGALFPIALLPGWLQVLARVFPQTYAIAAIRRVVMPQGDLLPGPSYGEAVVGLAIFVVLALPAAVFVFGRVMETGRRLGVLSGY
jgi:ABC-2 type transport system permease protein